MTLFGAKNILLTLAILLPSTFAWSADLVLRERATVNGPVIRLGDVADISANSTAQLKDLVTTPLFPTPAPGTQQFLHQTQIRDLLESRGIEVKHLRLRGAKVIEIGNRPTTQSIEPNMHVSAPAPPFQSQGETEALVEAAIVQYLIDRTGHEQWRVAVELQEKDYLRVASGRNNFTINGGWKPWTGRQRFQLSAKGLEKRVLLQASVTKVHTVLFARRAISRGSLVRTTDVEMRQHEGSVPSLAIRDPQRVIGMVATRTIAADSIFSEGQVSAPLLVKRGERVTVYARTGGVTVRAMAIARQDGAMGDLVQVESVNDKKRYAASVTGNRRLDVYPTGARVEDFATLGNRNTQQW